MESDRVFFFLKLILFSLLRPTSRRLPLQALGIPTSDGSSQQTDHRKIWQLFAEHFYLFRGTPSGLWLKDELLYNVFGVDESLNSCNAGDIYSRSLSSCTARTALVVSRQREWHGALLQSGNRSLRKTKVFIQLSFLATGYHFPVKMIVP